LTAAEDDIALIEHGFDAFSRGDLEASLAIMDPEIEWHVAFRLPDLPFDKPVYRGIAEVRELWTAFRSTWDPLTISLEEVIEQRDGVVIARARFLGRGRKSGIEVDRSVFYVHEIENGLLKRLRPFDTLDEALAAAP
jgi:ketosteroid isomerase-like protein